MQFSDWFGTKRNFAWSLVNRSGKVQLQSQFDIYFACVLWFYRLFSLLNIIVEWVQSDWLLIDFLINLLFLFDELFAFLVMLITLRELNFSSIFVWMELAKHPPSARFLSPSGGGAPSAAVKERQKKFGAPAVPHSCRNLQWGFWICAWFWNWTPGKWFL